MSKSYEINNLDDESFGLNEITPEEDNAPRKKTKKKKTYNILLLLFSFVISVGVWLYVTNLENDSYEKTVSLIPVSIVGAEELEQKNHMSVISGYDNTVTVTLTGKRTDVNKYSAANIYAYVNVSGIQSSERQTLPIVIDPIPDISVSIVGASEISVYADVRGEKEVELIVRPTYTIDGNYFINEDEIQKSVDSVKVFGPMSVLETIKYAVAETDIGKVTSSVTSKTTITLVNDKWNKVQNPYITCDTDSVDVSIPVKLKKTVELFCDYSEEEFEGYEVTVSVTENKLTVSGEVLDVNSLERICVFTLKKSHFDFEGTSAGTFECTKTVPIVLPEGIKNESDTPNVVIEATIKKIPEPVNPDVSSGSQQ